MARICDVDGCGEHGREIGLCINDQSYFSSFEYRLDLCATHRNELYRRLKEFGFDVNPIRAETINLFGKKEVMR